MTKSWLSGALAASCLWGGAALAADHRDGPAVTADPTTDITDVYAWMSSDGAKTYLVMNVQGGANGATATTKFSNTALYAFHLTSGAKFGDTTNKDMIVCQFSADAAQKISCWAPGKEYVTGDASMTSGLASADGKFKVFAGLRDDPFFFNIKGFRAAAMAIKGVGPALKTDPAGCPTIDANTSALLVATLKSDGKMGMPIDDFAKNGNAPVDNVSTTNGNILSIAVAIDTSLLATGGPMVSIWGSTNKTK